MDMVGHTGFLDAAIKAAEAVDECVGRIIVELKKQEGVAMITADHGNAEQMIADNGNPYTAHTLNPVPFILVDDNRRHGSSLKPGRLGDIAPTILHIMGIHKPDRMTGKSLLDT
jgi:2,3-bisphosphoglycerate-independent phosphoglycerate mutase